MIEVRRASGRAVVFALLFALAAMLMALTLQGSANADVAGITASAYGYTSNVGFLGRDPTR